jgi:hypothetical protein
MIGFQRWVASDRHRHEGSRIVVSGRRDDAGNALATELRALGVEAD